MLSSSAMCLISKLTSLLARMANYLNLWSRHPKLWRRLWTQKRRKMRSLQRKRNRKSSPLLFHLRLLGLVNRFAGMLSKATFHNRRTGHSNRSALTRSEVNWLTKLWKTITVTEIRRSVWRWSLDLVSLLADSAKSWEVAVIVASLRIMWFSWTKITLRIKLKKSFQKFHKICLWMSKVNSCTSSQSVNPANVGSSCLCLHSFCCKLSQGAKRERPTRLWTMTTPKN